MFQNSLAIFKNYTKKAFPYMLEYVLTSKLIIERKNKLKRGLKQVWEWKFDKRLYIGLLITTVCMLILQAWTKRYWGIILTVLCYLVYLFVLGCINHANEKKKLIKDVKEKRIFDIIDIKNLDGSYPNIYKTIKAKDGRVIYFIYTNVPLFEWEGKKENIERAFGAKVLGFGHGFTKNLIRISTVKEITELIIIQVNFENVFGADRDIQIKEKANKNNTYTIYSSNIHIDEYKNKIEKLEKELGLMVLSINKIDEKNIEIELSKPDKNK